MMNNPLRNHPPSLWARFWRLVNRANVAFQLLGGALLVTLVDLTFRARVRLGWSLGPANQPWPLWVMLAIPAALTLLWLTLAVLASVATYRDWKRQRQSAQQQTDPAQPPAQTDQRP